MDTTRIKKTIEDNKDGVTVDTDGNKVLLSSGFMVSITNNVVTAPEDGFIKDLVDNINTLGLSNGFIGSWVDDKTGEYYIDLSVLVPSFDDAKRIGRMFKQLATFDLSRMETVYF